MDIGPTATATLIASAVSIVVSIITGIWGPWAKHRIAIEMDRRRARRELIAKWRDEIKQHKADKCFSFMTDVPCWVEMSAHFTKDEIEACDPCCEDGTIPDELLGGPEQDRFIHASAYTCRRALLRIEKEWGLI